MNHLVNLYLSRNLGEKMLGCLIGDIMRSSNIDKYTPAIVDGIELNKRISNFVKGHPAYERSKQKLNPKYSKHSGRIIDIFYDHFLAANWGNYSNDTLGMFTVETHKFIEENREILPFKLKKMISIMIKDNWLMNLSSVNGIHTYMKELTRRDTFQTNLEYSLEDLINHYNSFKADFDALFPDLIIYVQELMQDDSFVLQDVLRK